MEGRRDPTMPVRIGSSMHLGVIILALVLFAQLLAAEAQKAGNVPKLGYVAVSPPECPLTPRGEAFLQGLRDLGYVLGQTIIVERRCYMAGDQLRGILNEFARLKVDVILAESPEQARP